VDDVILSVDGYALTPALAKRCVAPGNVAVGQTARLGLASGASLVVAAVRW
jgi:hypothetical protein